MFFPGELSSEYARGLFKRIQERSNQPPKEPYIMPEEIKKAIEDQKVRDEKHFWVIKKIYNRGNQKY